MFILNLEDMKINSNVRPLIVEVVISNSLKWVQVNFELEQESDGFTYEQVTLSYSNFNYAGVVDALVQYKYPIDKMQAVINNYLLDQEDAYAVDEFNKMQAWRKEAKEIAKEALLYELS